MESNIEEQKKLQIERTEIAKSVKELEFWLPRNKTHFKYEEKVADFQKKLNRLREINSINKDRGRSESLVLVNVFTDSASKEVYNRVKKEVKSRIEGNKPNIVRLMTDDEEFKIEKFESLNLENRKIKSSISNLVNTLDSMIIETKGNISAEMWNNIQDFNKQIIKAKRTLKDLLK